LAKITHVINRICIKAVQGVVSAMAAYCDLESVCVVRCATVYCLQYTILFDARCNHEVYNNIY